jgi:hypothetical protein
MAGHSRSKNGVASLAYAPAIHVLLRHCEQSEAIQRNKRKNWIASSLRSSQ